MPQPNKIPLAFAASGDKNTIPESTETTGLASWREGFPAIMSAPFSEGGIAPKRADFNGIFNALSLATLWQQQGGFYAYDNATDYEVGNVVLYSGNLYKCLSANGPSSAVKAPTDATVWAKVILTTATQSAAGYMSATDKAALDGIPTTYLPLSGGTMSGVIFSSSTLSLASPTNDSSTAIAGGETSSVSSGAWGVFYGINHSTYPGEFRFFTGSSGITLRGFPSGELTWNGDDVLTSPGIVTKLSTNISIPNNLITNVDSFTLTKGLYLVSLTAAFQNNTSGYRQIHIAASATGSSIDRFSSFVFAPAASTGTGKVFTFLNVTAASATYYFNVYQNSGTSLNVTNAGYQYLRLRSY